MNLGLCGFITLANGKHLKDFNLIQNISLNISESQYLFEHQIRDKISLYSSYSSCDLINKMPLVL